MKRICAFLSAAILCLTVITISYAAVPSFSATQWCVPPTGFGGGSRVIPTDTIVSYSDLRDYRTAVNKWLSEGQYSGFHGTASLTYTGSFYFIQLVQDGNVYWLCNGSGGRYRTETESSASDSATTTAPSTTAPSASKNEGTDRDSTYVSDPTAPSDSTTELNALNRLVKAVYTQIKSIHGLWRVNINMYNIQIKLRRLMWDTIDGINNVTTGIYKQVDLLTGYLPRLDDIYNRLFNIQSASWASVDVENRIYSGVAGIGSRLDSVITNGEVQINTTPLEARLDKLISMYSKVNSVVLDTAAINGGQIKDAVGGELKDVMFWGDTAKVDNTFVSSDGVAYSLNDEKTTVNGLMLRSVNLGSSVPSYIANDSVLYAGVWRKGTDYIISDTYNASTGEYVQRVENFAFSLDSISLDDCCYLERGGNTQLFCITLPVFPVPYDSAFNSNWSSSYLPVPYQAPFWCWENNDSNVDSLVDCFVFYEDRFLIVTRVKGALGNLRNWFCNLSPQFSFLYVPDPSLGWTPSVRMFDPSTITIPEGNSCISSYNVRITGKYETYDSYTQTADIIAAINNIPPYDDSGLIAAITGMTTPTVTTDLTAVTSRLDLILAELQSSSGSASCEHTYTQHMEQEADCTLPGLMISTCSQCGDSYSEIVDPLGHDWVVSSHVDAVTDPDTGEETASAYDVYTCSRCGRTYEDHTGDGAPDEDYSDTTISKLVVKVFSKLGTFAGKLIGFFVHLLDKALTSVDNVISKFNDYTAQISGFGGSYTTWLTGLWGIIPAELQIALTFSVICMALGAVGKKLLFS